MFNYTDVEKKIGVEKGSYKFDLAYMNCDFFAGNSVCEERQMKKQFENFFQWDS